MPQQELSRSFGSSSVASGKISFKNSELSISIWARNLRTHKKFDFIRYYQKNIAHKNYLYLNQNLKNMFSKEFKTAIQELPSAEKDKLIFRLLKRDLDLANRLHFELVDVETVDDKRIAFEKTMLKKIERYSERYYSVGYILQDTRFMSGEINQHVKITKDKFGEISLNIKMLIQVLSLNNARIQAQTYSKSYTLCIYVVARAFKILLLIKAIDEDYLIDFKEDLALLGNLIGQNPMLMKTAIHHGLDVNWLFSGEIPENIVGIHKELRANGYLK